MSALQVIGFIILLIGVFQLLFLPTIFRKAWKKAPELKPARAKMLILTLQAMSLMEIVVGSIFLSGFIEIV